MTRFYPRLIVNTGCIALIAASAGCGKKSDAGGDTASTSGSATATATPVSVSSVKVGRAIGADKRLTDETDDLKPKDVIYAVVETKGSQPDATLAAKWTYQDGQTVDSSSRSLATSGGDVSEFHIAKPSGWPKGKYKVEISLNGQAADSKDFEVK